MEKRDKTLIIIAIAICVVICCLAPFIASGNPDGLEKSAEDAGVPENAVWHQKDGKDLPNLQKLPLP